MIEKISPCCLILLVLFLVHVQGCTLAPPKLDREVEQQAIAYQQAGLPIAAAEEYSRLAQENEYYAEYFYLKAARSYLLGNNPDLAEAALKMIREDRLDPTQVFEFRLLLAQIALARDDALLALHYLKQEAPENTSDSLLEEYHTAKARALTMDAQPMNALYEHIKRNSYITSPEVASENNKQIWQLITELEVDRLEQALQSTEKNSEISGWIELGIITKSSLYDPALLESSISAWSKRYPEHPAQQAIIDKIEQLAKEVNAQPAQISLLLPFEEPYRDFSSAIRDGFLAAWYNKNTDNKPVITIYDTSQGDILDIYRLAIEQGAEFIVGPLTKESIQRLLDSDIEKVKTLTLNRLARDQFTVESEGTDITPLIYQYGLLPEDEAYQAAERIWLDGHMKVLVLTPDSKWGDRIFDSFKTHWTSLGGEILEHVKIFDTTTNYAIPVENLLNINQSKQRARELMSTLGRKLFYEPRRRQDADSIFMAVTPDTARQLVPQLRFYDAADLDTYSISSIFTGVYDPSKDSDINGVIFSEIPWIINPEYRNSAVQQQLNKALNQRNSPYRRLFAFGIDAYEIIPKLGSLYIQENSFQGNTGILRVNNAGQVERWSSWAKFVNGRPVLLNR